MSDRLSHWMPRASLLRSLRVAPDQIGPGKPEQLGWRDYALMLLHSGAQIEHALMVQYLYAGWSLGGPQVPEALRDEVRGWQQSVLSIAKEEMGHLISVQNVLALLGGPPAWGREDFPWDSAFYPFPFALEPLSLNTLARYVYAEAPVDWQGEEAEEICARIGAPMKAQLTGDDDLHHVAALYNRLIEVLNTPGLLADADFDPDSYLSQAGFAEWARNHGHPTGEAQVGWQTDPRSPQHRTAPDRVDMIVEPVATRDQAIASLRRVAEQGEAPNAPGERSHFKRFLRIYRRYKQLFPDPERVPYRPVASNPSTLQNGGNLITAPRTRRLASLSDLHYRLLLVSLAQALRLANDPAQHRRPGARASLLQHSFAEMYNLRALAGRLMRSPMHEHDVSLCAGPPFQLPYTLELPPTPAECWRLQAELVHTSETLCSELLHDAGAEDREFLQALRDGDRRWGAAVAQFLTASEGTSWR